jgi:AAA15 family ATPase/GTPase
MLLRFSVKNLFSFKDETEFNLLPGRITRLSHHKYSNLGIEVLKLSALYGANGAGKSNLIKAISLLRKLVMTGVIPNELNSQKFKLSPKSKKDYTYLGIEFIKNETAFHYSVKVNDGIIQEEEFCVSGLGIKKDEMLFRRTIDFDKKIQIEFFEGFEENKENVLLKTVIEKDLIKPDKPLIHLLQSLSSDAFVDIRFATKWFTENLEVIYPHTRPSALVERIDKESDLKLFAIDMMKSFQTGIANLNTETKSIEEFLGQDNQKDIDEITLELKKNPEQSVVIENAGSKEQVVIVNENDKIVSKRLMFEHKGEKNEMVKFTFDEESDGTRRLLEYIPAIKSVIGNDKVFIIDEIERSIHPLIVKELISKFSQDEKSKGQLVFSTHESNLLDQEIFRQDEIWFAEKNKAGATELYPLSEFNIDGQKEHHTINIQKGYLSGRYGAIPFLGNLTDLNWHKYPNG